MMNILGIQLFEAQSFFEFFSRFVFNSIVIYIIARLIYFRLRHNRNYMFMLFMFNVLVFFITYLLNNVKLSLGFAFGIFAIFSILRYRTTLIPAKEMTYMFISISLAVINALSTTSMTVAELFFTNGAVIAIAVLLEKAWVKNESKKIIVYEKMDLIKPEKRYELIADLKDRTGLEIHKVEIGRINFLRDTAMIRIYFYGAEDNMEDFDA